MTTIKAIEGRTVHQIQSGQVIVDLCSVVKELVENGLDAGATSIEVRFKNQGLEAIEVQDNGHGISPSNYETLALKHYTSKLSTYADLNTLQTFGFRGEALSSLCALSKFSVITCLGQDAPKGTRLEFEQSGALKTQSVVAAQKGTTVLVENLFYNLPVRKRELERNIKREWARVVNNLQQYACIQTGVKISVSQQAGKGKKTVIFSTKGNPTTRENVANIFGAKTIAALIPLDLHLELEPTNAPSLLLATQDDASKKDVRIAGHISRPASGEGRQTPDRQMFYVNGRPCILPQVSKAFNEAYKAYNASQSPFILANIELDAHMYDVNVSPDKKTILLHDQTRMLENLRIALTELFDKQDHTVPISQMPVQRQPAFKQLTLDRSTVVAVSDEAKQTAEETVLSEDERGKQDPSQSDGDDLSAEESMESPVQSKKNQIAVSRESLREGPQAISLISKWAGRNAEERVEPGKKRTVSHAAPDDKISNGKQLLLEKFQHNGPQLADQASTISNTETKNEQEFFENSPIEKTKDATDASHHVRSRSTMGEAFDYADAHKDFEAPIPSLHSPAKPSPSLASRFSATARMTRTGPDIATITIDGETTTSPIGSPAKRLRTKEPVKSPSDESMEPKAKISSFGSRLSQRFAAQSIALEEEDGDDEADEEGDESMHSSQVGQDGHDSEASAEEELSEEELSEDGDTELPHSQGEASEHSTSSMPEPSTSQPEIIDEDEEKALEAARVKNAIRSAEEKSQAFTQDHLQRTNSLLKGTKRKDSTLNLMRTITSSVAEINQQTLSYQETLRRLHGSRTFDEQENEGIDSARAEEKLSLTISKSDFAEMRIVGQFNLGFILATRTSELSDSNASDDLFIIDQHASDEKYNFERLYATTIVQSQRLVHPKTLELTAMEEELVLEHQAALTKNGFILSFDESGESAVGSRCQLLSLPLSRETTFSLSDLEELISILADAAPGSIPRPSKVRKMLAMRACRSSVMIGRTLTLGGMERLVRHLGELDKPWNCPHGRPTMRHLCGLGIWDEEGWNGDVADGMSCDGEEGMGNKMDWTGWLRREREEEEVEESGISDEGDDEEEDAETEEPSLSIDEEDDAP